MARAQREARERVSAVETPSTALSQAHEATLTVSAVGSPKLRTARDRRKMTTASTKAMNATAATMPTMAPTDRAAAGAGAGEGTALLVMVSDDTVNPDVDGNPAASAMAVKVCAKMTVSAAGVVPARTTMLAFSVATVGAVEADAGGVIVITQVTVTVEPPPACRARRELVSSTADTQNVGTPRSFAVVAVKLLRTSWLPALPAASTGTDDESVSV